MLEKDASKTLKQKVYCRQEDDDDEEKNNSEASRENP